MGHLQTAWLLVDREGAVCRARSGGPDETGVAPQEFQGLYEQIGRNTVYLIHPEEILADNFAQLYVATLRSPPPSVASPAILAKMRAILFQ